MGKTKKTADINELKQEVRMVRAAVAFIFCLFLQELREWYHFLNQWK